MLAKEGRSGDIKENNIGMMAALLRVLIGHVTNHHRRAAR